MTLIIINKHQDIHKIIMYDITISDKLDEEVLQRQLEKNLLNFKECEKAYQHILQTGKQAVDEEFQAKKKTIEGKHKIQRSALINTHHMKKATIKYKMCEQIFEQVLISIKRRIAEEEGEYCLTLIGFIVEGALRMFEPQLSIRCLPEHSQTVKRLIPDAEICFQEIMELEAGRSFPVKLILNTTDIMKERQVNTQFEKKHEQEYCVGGIILTDATGNITYKNTMDTRLNILKELCLPQMRQMLWPKRSC